MKINWYPGHMAKAKREITESLKLVDIVIELLDARIPESSRNPDVDALCKGKPRIIVLNKSDLADEKINRLWIDFFEAGNEKCVEIDSITGKGIKNLLSAIRKQSMGKNKKLKEKGMLSKPVRAMIIGIPNVGKSSLINRISGRGAARTGDKPGVTKGRQWIKTGNDIDLLDTPGILWPKLGDEETGLNLSLTGAINDEIIDIQELSYRLIDKIKHMSSNTLKQRFGIENTDEDSKIIIEEIAKGRGCMMRGGEPDIGRVSKLILNEFRSGKLGKISLESPHDGGM